jgi:hypothetical protein
MPSAWCEVISGRAGVTLLRKDWANRAGTSWRAIHDATQITVYASWSAGVLDDVQMRVAVLDLIDRRVTQATQEVA